MQAVYKLYSAKILKTIFWMFKRISNNTATLEECERPFIAIIIEMSQSILSMKEQGNLQLEERNHHLNNPVLKCIACFIICENQFLNF